MDFGSLRRKSSERSKENRKAFSISNISFTSGSSSTSVIRKSLSITLPRDLGIQQDVDGRVVKLSKSGSAHLSGVIQVGDLVNVFASDLDLRHSPTEESPLALHDDEFVNVNIIYGVLQVESRPLCPLIVEIGNRNNTSLGLALADAPGEKIRISSIQPGSLAERCGYLKPHDVLISIQVKEDKTVSCSPYYTSFETAQIIRGITSSMPSMVLTILPYEAEQLQLQQQHISLFNMLSTAGNVKYKKEFGSESTLIPDSGQNENVDLCGANNFHDNSDDTSSKDRGADEENFSVLSFSLWKDRLYEDWGFSLSDSMESQEDSHGKENYEGCKAIQSSPSSSSGKTTKKCQREREAVADSGSEILQIRPGGPAYAAGIQPGDKIIQINHEDVSHLESTMLVPILASLEDSLNLTVIRLHNDGETS